MKSTEMQAKYLEVGDDISGYGIVTQIVKGDKKIEFMIEGRRFPKRFHPQTFVTCIKLSQRTKGKGFSGV